MINRKEYTNDVHEIVLNIRVPEGWIKDIGNDLEASIRFLDCVGMGGNSGRGLVEIVASDDISKRIIEKIQENPNVCQAVFTYKEGDRSLGTVETDRCYLCKALTNSQCFLAESVLKEGGGLSWTLLASELTQISMLMDNLKKTGCQVDLVRKSKLTRKDILTKHQENIIRAAHDRGYFHYPRGISLKELAKVLNISPSTLSETLRRGEEKIMSKYFEGR